ncbi:MAG: hypothetical protein ACYTEL_26055, partial [Planctomycetota bacterium]
NYRHWNTIVDLLIEYPVITIPFVGWRFNLTFAAARRNVQKLVRAGILTEITGRKRKRIYIAQAVLNVITKPVIAPPDPHPDSPTNQTEPGALATGSVSDG